MKYELLQVHRMSMLNHLLTYTTKVLYYFLYDKINIILLTYDKDIFAILYYSMTNELHMIYVCMKVHVYKLIANLCMHTHKQNLLVALTFSHKNQNFWLALTFFNHYKKKGNDFLDKTAPANKFSCTWWVIGLKHPHFLPQKRVMFWDHTGGRQDH